MSTDTTPTTDGESSADGLCLAERPGDRLMLCTLPDDHDGTHEAYDELSDQRESWSGPVTTVQEAM